MNCPGSNQLSEGMENRGSVFASEGTAAHEVCERALRDSLPCVSYMGDTVSVDGLVITVTLEMCEAAQIYVDHIRDRMDEMGYAGPVDMFIEHQFDLSVLNPPGPMYGTSDCTLWSEGNRHLDVNDFKYGAGVTVDAEGNSQLMMYALGAVVELGKVPNTIRVTIVQPRGHHPDGTIRSFEFTYEELVAFKKELLSAAALTFEPDAELNAGSWCRFCPAHAVCPAKRDLANDMAVQVFDAVTPDDAGAHLPSPEILTDEEVAHILRYSGTVMDWLRSVEGHVQRKLERGEDVEGYKLVTGRSNRRWVDAKRAEVYLRGRGLKKDERHTLKLVSPAQAEKLLKGGNKLPEHLYEKPDGKLKMVSVQDSRPAIERGAATSFGIMPGPSTDKTENN